MRIGVCGIACEKCARMTSGACPNGDKGCVPKSSEFCQVCTCGFEKGIRFCFDCPEFPCETSKLGPIDYGFCLHLADKTE